MGWGYLPHPDLEITESFMQPFGRTPHLGWIPSAANPACGPRHACLNLPADAATFRVSGSKTFSFDALNTIQQATQSMAGSSLRNWTCRLCHATYGSKS